MIKSLFRIIFFLSIASIGKSLLASDLDSASMKHQISISASSYSYTEPNLTTLNDGTLDIKIRGMKLGIEYLGILELDNNYLILGGVDYNNGSVDYEGSGKLTGIPEYYYSAKIAFGRKIDYTNYTIKPYIGYGYRYLKESGGGMTTTTNAWMYDRASTYNYIPIGIIHEMPLQAKNSKLTTTFEYNQLVSGNQFSGLSVGNGTRNGTVLANIPDINNSQTSGYGLNLSVMYSESKWSIGPYIKYWNIAQSDTVSATILVNGASRRYSAWEPANNTVEYGIKISHNF